jgi:BlaI family transcriptional regulator, penicillinase repressor
MTTHLESAQDLALLLGPRQADIMRLLWTHGPATVREVHAWLLPKVPLAYTTVMTLCVTLTEKGVLERQIASERSQPRARKGYVYAPRMSEAEFTHRAVSQRIDRLSTQYPALVQAQITGTPALSRCGSSDRARVEHVLAYLGTLCDPLGQAVDTTVLDTITGLLERAAAAERTAATRETEIQAAEQRAAAAEQRALAAEQRAMASEQLAARLMATNTPPRSVSKNRPPPAPIYEYRDDAGICRVCGRPAPPAWAPRQDDLRACREECCRKEGRRRDNVVKQRRARDRRRAGQAEAASAASLS